MENLMDINDAMTRLSNNKKLYATLLKKFDGKAMIDDLINKIKTGDSAASAAQAHTIKGLAANLSLKDLREKAESVEVKIKGGETNIDMSEISQSLDKTLEAVNEWITQNQ